MADPLSVIDKTLLSKYRVQGYLGGGGFGFVYRGYDERLREEVALKFPKDSDLNEAIIKEAQTLNRLDELSTSGHILRFFTLVNIDGRETLVTELCRGGALRSRIPASRRCSNIQNQLPQNLTCHIMMQICHGLEEAHSIGCVHRDVKPENIFLSEPAPAFGIAKLGDFGIAAILQTSRAPTRVGTRIYMSPEVLSGKGADCRSDVYSVGVTLYELLTGSMPFNFDMGDYPLMQAIVNGDAIPVSNHPQVDSRLQAVVNKAMHLDPAKRYQTSAELRAALEDVNVDLLVEAALAQPEDAAGEGSTILEIENELSSLCQKFPKSRRPYVELAKSLRNRGCLPQAVEIYENALANMGQDRRVLYLLAQNYADMEDYFSAIGVMGQAIGSPTRKRATGGLTPKETEAAKSLLAAWKRRLHK